MTLQPSPSAPGRGGPLRVGRPASAIEAIDDRRWPGARRRGWPGARTPGRRSPTGAQRTDPDSLPRSAAHRPPRASGTSARQSRTPLSGRLRLVGKSASCPHKFGDQDLPPGHGVHAAWPAFDGLSASSSPSCPPAGSANPAPYRETRPARWSGPAASLTSRQRLAVRRPQPILATLPARCPTRCPVHAAVSSVPRGPHRRPDPP
jgi:hypothetical protein